jgi:hypothetical protein
MGVLTMRKRAVLKVFRCTTADVFKEHHVFKEQDVEE